jgi:peptidoglycan/xylan/chitin deacetylase (PgdA/CDA1 family)
MAQAFWLATLMLATGISCAHGSKDRAPASFPSEKETVKELARDRELLTDNISFGVSYSTVTSKEPLGFMSVVAERNLKRLKQLFRSLRIGQVLIASFDQRLHKLAKSPHVTSEVPLLSTKFYQKLATTRELHLAVEEKLRAIFQSAQGKADQLWLRDQIELFGKEDSASARTAGVLAHYLADAINCDSNACRKSLSLERIGFDPFDDIVSLKFSRDHVSEIAQFAELKEADFEAAEEFSGNRKPNSTAPPGAAEYNWHDRNWVKGSLADGQFVFTYDDGPSAEYTKPIKNLWAATQFEKPTYFRQVNHVLEFPDLVREDFIDGYAVGVHSERHPDIGNLDKAQGPNDLNKPNRLMFLDETAQMDSAQFGAWRDATIDRETIGAIKTFTEVVRTYPGFKDFKFRMFRLPYGSGMRAERVTKNFLKANVDHFYWAVDSLDWGDPNPESIKARVFEQMRLTKKGLILMHDVHPQTVEATRLILDELSKSTEFSVVGIKTMFKDAMP